MLLSHLVSLTPTKAKTPKWIKILAPSGSLCSPFSPSGGLHCPGTSGALFRHSRFFCKMRPLWFDIPPLVQIQPSHFFGSHTDSWLSFPSPGVTAFSWQTCDFATWEDLTPGIAIKLGQNRACYYSTVWGQDLSWEVL